MRIDLIQERILPMTNGSIRRKAISITVIIFMVVAFMLLISARTYAASAPTATGQVDAEGGVYLRSKASVKSDPVTVLENNTQVVITKEVFSSKFSTAASKKWYYVKANGYKGYVRGDLISNIKFTTVSAKVTGALNYRKGAGILMKKIGTFSKGDKVKVCLEAKPVAATKGSNAKWYRIKIGNKYYFACSSLLTLTGSTSKDSNTKDSDSKSSSDKTSSSKSSSDKTSSSKSSDDKTSSSKSSSSSTSDSSASSKAASSSDFAKMTSKQFDSYLTKQGFPEAYKKKLKALHKKHPNWVFIADKTGIKWDDALRKETRNGVSLIHASYPTSYRSTDSNSYTGSDATIYKSASTSTKKGTLKTGEKVTVTTEVWKGTTRWSKIKTSSGKTGYVKGAPSSQSHSKVITGKTNSADVNVRYGAGTSNSVAKTLSKKGTKVEVVLQTKDKDGNIWYKIRNGGGYAYILSDFVNLDATVTSRTENEIVTPSKAYPSLTLKSNIEYRAVPDTAFPAEGKILKKSVITVIAKCVATGQDGNETKWYQVYLDGRIIYVKADGLKVKGSLETVKAPSKVTGVVTADVLNYRKDAGTNAEKVGELKFGNAVTIKSTKVAGKEIWYQIVCGKKKGYISSAYVAIDLAAAPEDAAPTVKVEVTETKTEAKPGSLTNTASFAGNGKWIPKDGATWFNASSTVVAYYMDPRNFLNEDRIYMFEDLSYKKEYQTKDVIAKVLSGTKLPTNGFTAKLFLNAGKANDISPVHLAARARQETGGGSIAITGYKISGVKVFNPFNIGASSCANPVLKGLKYAFSMGWRTQKKAVNGGASFLAKGYINKGQNSCYYQRFNVSNGLLRLGSHQYMTNITAPYSEAYSTKLSYASFGITEEPLTFVIPVFKNMPSTTNLP